MPSNNKRLGDYINPVKVKNKNLEATLLLGINIDKFFMPSVANVIGTDMSNYKIVNKNQFACNRMHVGRDYRIPVALSNKEEPFMVSPAYDVFEIKDTSVLVPEFLMMWFSRREFDRNAWFYTDADVRGGLHWKAFCDMRLPIPSPEKQQEIVREYNIIQNRIVLNNQLITKLEDTAKAIYKQWFVDFEFPDSNRKAYKSNSGEMVWCEELEKEIPEGWNVSKLGKEYELTIGRTPPRIERKWFNQNENSINWISIKDLASCQTYIFHTNENLTLEAVKKFSIPIIKENTTIMSFKMSIGKLAITTKEMLSNEAIVHFNRNDKTKLSSEFIYCFLNQFKFNILGSTSSIVESINTQIIKNIDFLVPNDSTLKTFDKIIKPIFKNKKNIELQSQRLEELKDLLLARMTRVESELETVNI
jgi:type I restriction enzyme S subunit